MNEQLFTDLYNAAEYYRITDLYEQIKACYRNDQQECIAKYMSMKERKESPVVANVLCMLFAFPVLCLGFAAEGTFPKIFIIIGLFMLIGFPILNNKRCKNATKKYQQEAEDFWYREGGYISAEDEKNYNKAQRELETFQKSNCHVLDFLPHRYRNYTATLFLANAVANCRADTLKEAINLYEQQLHQWEMERINQEIVYQNTQIQERLAGIYEQQADTNRKLRNIEALEFYQVIQNM